MPAYIIVDINVIDPVRYADYRELVDPTVARYDGRYVVCGGPVEVLEGSRQPGRIVILEFPSRDRAKSWWDSEAYRRVKAIRQAAATTEMILIDGI